MSEAIRLSEFDAEVVKCDMKVAEVDGDILHIFDKWYAVVKDCKHTHMFNFNGISKTRTTFYKMSHIYKDYYFLQANGAQSRWINFDKKKSDYVNSSITQMILADGHMKKIMPVFEKYNLNIEKYLFTSYAPFNYHQPTQEIYIWSSLHYNYIFAHIYPDSRETFSVRVSKQSEIGPYLDRIAGYNVENTTRIFGCCELSERYLKSTGIKFPFSPRELNKISLDKNTYNFHYSKGKVFTLFIAGDALSQKNEFSEFPHHDDIVKDVINEIKVFIKDEISKKNRKITIPYEKHYDSKPIIAWLNDFCAEHKYTGTYYSESSNYYINTL